MSETCRFYSENKLEKLVRLVDFTIRIYHDARSPECIFSLFFKLLLVTGLDI